MPPQVQAAAGTTSNYPTLECLNVDEGRFANRPYFPVHLQSVSNDGLRIPVALHRTGMGSVS